jgi:tRNA A-37 threonylcarbamoyl transferase component Bud32
MLKEITQLVSCRDKVALYLDGVLKSFSVITHKSKNEKSHDIKGHTIFETKSSIVLELEDGNILKCLKIRHWTEYHKLLLGKSRAKEEVASNYEMHNIGLAVPEIVYCGIFSNLFSKRAFSSFYCMKCIPSSFSLGNTIYSSLNENAKNLFIKNIFLDIEKLKDHHLVYSDLNLKNLFLNNNGEHYWIDTQVKNYSQDDKFRDKFNHSLNRFINNPKIEFSRNDKEILNTLLIDRP